MSAKTRIAFVATVTSTISLLGCNAILGTEPPYIVKKDASVDGSSGAAGGGGTQQGGAAGVGPVDASGGKGGSSGNTPDGSSGTGGAAGNGSSGSGGASGSSGTGGNAGAGASGGSGTGGNAGSSIDGGSGAGGSAGTGVGGSAGSAGKGGAAGSGGTGATGGTGGAAGSGGAGGGGGIAGASGSGGAAGASGAAGSGGAAGTGGTGGGPTFASVLQHHNHANRDGVYVDPVFTKAAAATTHIDTAFAAATYASNAHGQPLYLVGAGSVPDLVIIGTTQNHVLAFNAATGAKVWDQTLGPSVPSSNLACAGNINPVGVVGTPVIDEPTRTIYLNSMQLNGTPQDLVYALDADTGATKAGWPVDLNTRATSGGTVFNTPVQNQRGALALVGGRVLVPFGGHIGDCGDYRGWVVSVSASDPTVISTFATRVLGGGIWGPGGVASDGTSVFFATGNTMGTISSPSTHPAMYGDGESVFKLPPDLTRTMATTEYFVPTNWSMMDDTDADIGGTGALPVDVPGATPSKLLVQLGKDRKAYLIDRDTMGGQSAPLSSPTVATGSIINAPVTYKTAMGTYVVFRGVGSGCPSGQSGAMTALKITASSPPTAAVAWCGGATSKKSPAVSMTDASGTDTLVWQIGDDNKLRAYDGDTGTVVFDGGAAGDTMATVAPFQTPIVVNGRLFAASGTQIYAFTP